MARPGAPEPLSGEERKAGGVSLKGAPLGGREEEGVLPVRAGEELFLEALVEELEEDRVEGEDAAPILKSEAGGGG